MITKCDTNSMANPLLGRIRIGTSRSNNYDIFVHELICPTVESQHVRSYCVNWDANEFGLPNSTSAILHVDSTNGRSPVEEFCCYCLHVDEAILCSFHIRMN